MKRKLAVFSTMPPTMSGIADYTYELLCDLREYYDIEVFLDDNQHPPPDDARLFKYHHYTAYARRHSQVQFIATLYQFGNSFYHFYQYQQLPFTHNNIVTIHDTMWCYSLVEYNRQNGTLPALRGEIAQYVNAEQLAIYDAAMQMANSGHVNALNDWLKNNWLLDKIFQNSVAQIMHNSAIQEAMQRYPDHNLYLVRQAAKVPLVSKEEGRARSGLERFKFIVGTFGHVSPNKRVEKVIESFKLLLADHPDSLLMIVGPQNDENYDQHLRSLCSDIMSNVAITGFIEKDDLAYALAATDVCVQLRTEAQGATSGMITRSLGAGKPIIMSAIKEWDDYPSYFALKVSHGEDEVKTIAEYLSRLADYPETVKSLGDAARNWYKTRNDFQTMVGSYQNIIEINASGMSSIFAD